MDHSVPMLANFEALPDMLTAKDLEYSRIESNVRFSKHQVKRWLEERSFQPRPVNGKSTKRQ